ncbi:CvpA family protein [Amphritea opalescens]|uniref:CvpA family protein n=1 Tax=Amphritea opalescens TaxID=2490544 RepID=A0A430KVT1_9GAMM|nr:CvpA family protein [Amphritea opalescens]RTE67599.1 CvpA family protein [Amphritea opalescens]
MVLNWADWAIIGIITVSGLYSLRGGFMKEALSLATWVAAFVVARLFAPSLSTLLDHLLETPSLRIGAAFILLFIATLMVGAVINSLINMLVQATGLSSTDRILGIGFGVVRGGLIVIVITALLVRSPVTQDSWWAESQLIPHFLLMESWTRETAADIGQMIWNISGKNS